MHILLIHQAFSSLDEAGGTRHHEMAIQLVKQGHRVTIISSPVSYLTGKSRSSRIRWKEEDHPQPGITIYRAYTFQSLHKSFFHRLISFFSFMFSSFFIGMRVREVDLVWGTTPPIFQGITAWLISRLKDIPFLFEVRDLWPAFAIAVGILKNSILIRLSNWLERFLYRQADCLVVNSPGYIQHVKDRGAKRIELVENGSDPDMFNPNTDGSAIRSQWGLTNEFVVLYAGAHGMSNDLEVILHAAKILSPHHSIKFVFIGDGKEKPVLQAKAKALALSNIIWAAPAPKNQMSDVLAAANACIAILKPIEMYKTTYPNKVFDYMAAGRPVLLAIDGVIRQVVEVANAGIFIQPGNPDALATAILHLSANPALATQMGINGRSYIEQHFNRSHLAIKLIRIIEGMGDQYARKNSNH